MEIEDLINNVVDQDFSKAAPTFAEIMQSKMDDALEQEKIAMADVMFNGGPEEMEPSEEDIAAAIDELEDDEFEDEEEQLEMDLEDEDG
jgi:hypothetical protein